MSIRKAWPVRTAFARLIGAARLPSTSTSSAVRRTVRAHHHDLRQSRAGLDEIAVCIGCRSGTLSKVCIREVDAEQIAACALTTFQVAMPPISVSSAVPNLPSAPRFMIGDQLAGRMRIAVGVPSRRRAGTPGARDAMSRSGSGRRRVRWYSALVDVIGRAQDAIGARAELVAACQHHEVGTVAARRTNRGSSACSGMKIVPLPPLVTRSRP